MPDSVERLDLLLIHEVRICRMVMLDDALVRRGDCDGNPITEIAMWGIRRKPEEQGAE
jgi:hypothetical protein